MGSLLAGCSASPEGNGTDDDLALPGCSPPPGFWEGPPRVLFKIEPDADMSDKPPWEEWTVNTRHSPPFRDVDWEPVQDWCFLVPLNADGYTWISVSVEAPDTGGCRWYFYERIEDRTESFVHVETELAQECSTPG
jgi:hypothetical protein